MAIYQFACFAPVRSNVAAKVNPPILAIGKELLFGIEVTEAELAQHCYANLDPQHDGSGSQLCSAEAAVRAQLPRLGATLVTLRLDLDALLSMAIFELRANGVAILTPEMEERIAKVAAVDKAATAAWKKQPFQDKPTVDEMEVLSALCVDHKKSIEVRVEEVLNWLMTGQVPSGYEQKILAEKQVIFDALASGAIQLTEISGIAIVIAEHRSATAIAYKAAPVGVCLNPSFKGVDGSLEPHAKFTVCQFSLGYCDIVAVQKELANLEPGWGGGDCIIGSPQGVASTLSIDLVVAIVRKDLVIN